MIDWSQVAIPLWGARYEEEKPRRGEFTWVGHYREYDCKYAAIRIDNFGRCMREAGMLAMLDRRYRRW